MLGLIPCMWGSFGSGDDADVRGFEVRLVVDAIEAAHYTEKEACAFMRLSQSQWNEQKAGNGHISYTRMWRLPVEIRQWIGLLTVEELGIPSEVRRAARLVWALRARKAMARISRLNKRQKARRTA